ncbi:MAG: toxin co-regulated pilus biosynthesis Q family protein, partial [Alphaproteobacteria bacterium]|nr:toxin co-regulated pilus biosynthesis Q family protein [Alphaproteobacteria bacterium]
LLTQWFDESGWWLIWNTNRNYTLNAGAMFRGSFADVASALVRAFARARPAPIATFYKGNRVLVIQTMEDENAYD